MIVFAAWSVSLILAANVVIDAVWWLPIFPSVLQWWVGASHEPVRGQRAF